MLGSLFSGDSNIDGYLLVYDITSRTSLETLEYFDELIEKNLESGLMAPGTPQPVKIVAGNKCDLSEARCISSAEGLAWAKQHGCGFMETSAKVMVNVEETFEQLIRQVTKNRIAASAPSASAGKNNSSMSNSRANNTFAGETGTGGMRPKISTTNLRSKEESGDPKKDRNGCCVIC